MKRILLAGFLASPSVSAYADGAPPPAAPPSLIDSQRLASYCYSIALSDDFKNLATISTAPTAAAGFNWYTQRLFGYSQTTAESLALDDEGLVINPLTDADSGGNYTIATAGVADNADGYVGQTYSNGFYVEARIKFDPSRFRAAGGYPAIWMESIKHAANKGASQWPGQEAGFERFIEDGIFQYNVTWAPKVAFGGAVHDWFGLYPNFTNLTNAGPAAGTPFNNFVVAPSNLTPGDWNTWHTVGQLWVKGSPANGYHGYLQTYFDGRATNMNISWTDNLKVTPETLSGSPSVFSIMDEDAVMLVLGSGTKQPFHVQWVHVWTPTCQ